METPLALSTDAMNERLTAVRPSPRQLAWQELGFYAFVHFGMNTMTDREWGLGHEDPALFDPVQLDADQWMKAIASAGMRGVILTAKHHDGFCLWPSSETRHSVASSPWRSGDGDLVREVSEAAARHNLRLGIYLSPWDRTDARYGSGQAYDDYFVAQLRELLTAYGPIFSVWFDGAMGEGPNGRRQEYDWDRYYETIRQLQPDAVICVCGPDVRWCGNEAGHTRAEEWSVVPQSLQDVERIAEGSQQVDDGEFSRTVLSGDEDLGSREALNGVDDLVWYPAEVNTSIRPGWFHHLSEDSAVRPAEELFDIWTSSTGRNACFLLNVPPNRQGLVADPDVQVLKELGALVRGVELARLPATASASSGHVPETFGALERRPDRTFWEPDASDPFPTLELRFADVALVNAVEIAERIEDSQRVERLRVVGIAPDGSTRDLVEAQSIGYRRILRFEPMDMIGLRVEILSQRASPRLTDAAALTA